MEDPIALRRNFELLHEQFELLRRAAEGHTDWELVDNYYVNRVTGEREDEKPRLVELAEAIVQFSQLKDVQAAADKSKKRLAGVELKLRETEVLLQKSRSDATDLRQILNDRDGAATSTMAHLSSFSEHVNGRLDIVELATEKLSGRLALTERATPAVKAAAAKIQKLSSLLSERDSQLQNMTAAFKSKEALLKAADAQVADLGGNIDNIVQGEVLRKCAPLEKKLVDVEAEVHRLRVIRQRDLEDLALLWPPGWLHPSILRPFVPTSPEAAREEAEQALRRDAERELRESIRDAVAEAAKWKVKTDEYGRNYWENRDTGEASFERPEAAAYIPPLGRDELGNAVDPDQQLLDAWSMHQDEWGRDYFQNSITGEVAWEAPEGWGDDEEGKVSSDSQEHDESSASATADSQPHESLRDAVQAARIVLVYLKKRLTGGSKWDSADIEELLAEEEFADDEHEEVIWDIQSVVNLAKGEDDWSCDGGTPSRQMPLEETQKQIETTPEQERIRHEIVALSRAEDRHESRLWHIRQHLARLSHSFLSLSVAISPEASDPEGHHPTQKPPDAAGAKEPNHGLLWDHEIGAPLLWQGYNSSQLDHAKDGNLNMQLRVPASATAAKDIGPSLLQNDEPLRAEQKAARSLEEAHQSVQKRADMHKDPNGGVILEQEGGDLLGNTVLQSHPFRRFMTENKENQRIGAHFAVTQLPVSADWNDSSLNQLRLETQKLARKKLVAQIVEGDRKEDFPETIAPSKLLTEVDMPANQTPVSHEDPKLALQSALRYHADCLNSLLDEECKLAPAIKEQQDSAWKEWRDLLIQHQERECQARAEWDVAEKARLASLDRVRVLKISRPEPILSGDKLPSAYLSLDSLLSQPQEGRKALSSAAFKELVQKVEAGEYDKCDFWLPSGSKVSSKQEDSLRQILCRRREEVESTVADRARANFELKRREWLESEKQRSKEVEDACVESRRSSLVASGLRSIHLECSAALKWIASLVAEREKVNISLAQSSDLRSIQRAKELMESKAGLEYTIELQDRLGAAEHERKALISTASGASTAHSNALVAAQWEVECSRRIATLDVEIVRLRAGLIREGRRLRKLHKEEISSASAEVGRLKVEKAGLDDLSAVRSMVLQMHDSKINALLKEGDLRAKEASGVRSNIIGALTEEWPEDWPWVNNELEATQKKIAELCNASQVLKACMERSNKCCSTVRELVRSAGMGHGVSFSTEDQWTPMAENTRLLEALGDMSEVHTREMTALVDACANEKARAQAKERECEFALIELAREKRLRAMEFEASRSTSIQAIEHLRKELNTAQDESAKRINSLENALTELRSEYTSERRRLKRVADEAVEAAKRREGWICALRNDLSLESARRFSAESKLADLQDEWRTVGSSLRTELRGVRSRCARLILKCAMLVDAAQRSDDNLSEERLAHASTREVEAARRQSLLAEGRRHLEALKKLCGDGTALFQFFIARVAELSGSSAKANDAMAKLGAIPVLAAMTYSSDSLIRRLAARALSQIGWNGKKESRIMGWEVKKAWLDWVEDAHCVSSPIEAEGNEEEGIETTPQPLGRAVEAVRGRLQWALRREKLAEGPNLANQRSLGLACTAALIKLCSDPDQEVVCDAVATLSVAAYHDDNARAMGENDECLHLLVKLCGADYGWEIRGHAASALANIGCGSQSNQASIGRAGGVEVLATMLRSTTAEESASSDTFEASIDSLEAATAALTNLVSLDDANCYSLVQADGIELLSSITLSFRGCDALDVEKAEAIRSNASETLANLARVVGGDAASRLAASGMKTFVLMCASESMMTRRNAALVLGNMAQLDELRNIIGEEGGLEALALLLEPAPVPGKRGKEVDPMCAANALWAMASLATTARNQERVGRYFPALLSAASFDDVSPEASWLPVRVNALSCIASALYHNKANRHMLLTEKPEVVKWLLHNCDAASSPLSLVESSLRCLISLSFDDEVALSLGRMDAARVLCEHAAGKVEVLQSLALACLANLAVHAENRPRITDAGGIEVLVAAEGSSNAKVVGAAQELLEAIEVLGQAPPVLSASVLGVEGLLRVLGGGASDTDAVSNEANDAFLSKAAELLAQEAWCGPSKQAEIVSEGGMKVFVAVCSRLTVDSRVLVQTLWALRNTVLNFSPAKLAALQEGAMEVLIAICRRFRSPGQEEVVAAALSALTAVATGHPESCKRLIRCGMEDLLDIASNHQLGGSLPKATPLRSQHSSAPLKPAKFSLAAHVKRLQEIPTTVSGPAMCPALATNLLNLMCPFSHEQCASCGIEQDGGEYCINCGRTMQSLQVPETVRAPLASAPLRR